MRKTLDVVIPVKMPSRHLSVMREYLIGLPSDIKINYVLDYPTNSNLPSQLLSLGEYERVYYGNFSSPGEARNFALNQCDAEYVAFWDVDDFPNLIEIKEFLACLKTSGADLGIGNWTYFDAPNDLRGFSPLAVGMSPGIWRFIFKQDLISNIRFSTFRWGEDQLFLVNVFEKNPSVYLFPNPVYSYVKYVEGALTTKTEFVFDLIKVNECFVSNLVLIQGNARICFEIMNLKQIYTVLKYGQRKAALKLILKLLRELRERDLSLIELMYRAWRMKGW